MLEMNVVLKPIIGAIIGYTTNWLAIKMLFRPYTEKRIGAFRLPFTPGLIPRERKRIARSLGTAVGEKLLTEAVIGKELIHQRVLTHIQKFIIENLLKEEQSVEDILNKLLGEESSIAINKGVKLVVTEVEKLLTSETLLTGIHHQVKDYIRVSYPYNTSVEVFLSNSTKASIEEMLMVHKEKMSAFIVRQSRKQTVVEQVRTAVEQLIAEKVGALGAMFIDPLDVTHALLNYIEEAVYEEKVQDSMVQVLMEAIEEGRQMDLSQMLSIGQYEEVTEQISTQVTTGMKEITKRLNIRKLIEPVLLALIKRKIHLSYQDKEKIGKKVVALYVHFIQTHMGSFLENFQLKEVVEGEVNAFEVAEVEALIFTIVDKELTAITWFGALLGFIMGIVYIFL